MKAWIYVIRSRKGGEIVSYPLLLYARFSTLPQISLVLTSTSRPSSSVISLISTSISIHVLKIITFNDHVVRSALSQAIRMLLQAYTMNLVHIPYWILFIAQEEICKWSSYRAINLSFFFKLGKKQLNCYIFFYDGILNLYSFIYCLSSRYQENYIILFC